jgi:hypothetical protein
MARLLDNQKYAECQLVAVINAAAFLGEPPVDPASEEYERLVDYVGARHGAAVSPRPAASYLRLILHDIDPLTIDNVRCQVMSGRPVHVGIRHPILGHHAVLLTDGDGRGMRVWNMRRKGFPKNRLSWERLREMMAAVAPQCRAAFWYELDPLRVRQKEK